MSSPLQCSKTTSAQPAARYCLCAPTTHPGSFRCRLHRSPPLAAAEVTVVQPGSEAAKDAAAARAFLVRVVQQKQRRQGVPGIIRPGPSRLGPADEQER
ncbi:hypothetical protein QOZ80_2AG0104040 [Eleusine coracana subsp. coracana]|nr:hypothetical protein QOZ80_2AG0104040 [Eleusine coracana subsp. coracana]